MFARLFFLYKKHPLQEADADQVTLYWKNEEVVRRHGVPPHRSSGQARISSTVSRICRSDSGVVSSGVSSMITGVDAVTSGSQRIS